MYAHDSPSCLLTSVPDSPHEPDPEPYEPMPPCVIPLDEVSSLPTLTRTHAASRFSSSWTRRVPAGLHHAGGRLRRAHGHDVAAGLCHGPERELQAAPRPGQPHGQPEQQLPVPQPAGHAHSHKPCGGHGQRTGAALIHHGTCLREWLV